MPGSHQSKSTRLSDYCCRRGLAKPLKVRNNNDLFVLSCIQPPPKAKNTIHLDGGCRERVKDNQKHLGIPEVKVHLLKNPNLLCLQV